MADVFEHKLKRAHQEILKLSVDAVRLARSIADDVEFCRVLQDENILAVPGSGFMGPGHMRLAYCCSRSTVEKSLPGFRRAIQRVQG